MDTPISRAGAVWLETINPLDLTPDDLLDLAEDLAEAVPDFEYEVWFDEQQGAGVTWFEVLHVWLPYLVPDGQSIRDDTEFAVLNACGVWMRSRFARKHGSRRPKSIVVHDAEGREIAHIVIDGPDAEARQDALDPMRRGRPHGRHRRS